MLALIIAAGELAPAEQVRRVLSGFVPDLVICADGGLAHAETLGLTPHLIVGDFDSVSGPLLERHRRQGVMLQELPTAKDETDTEVALAAALARGATELVLLGATGTRLDHTLANLLLLTGLPSGVQATVVSGHNIIQVLAPDSELRLSGQPGDLLSLIPLSPEVQVWAEGVRWPLVGDTLRWGQARGVSNEWTARVATVRTAAGWLAVMQAWD